VLDRELAEVTSSSHLQRHLVDMIGSEVDDDAQRCLRELKTVKLTGAVSTDSCIRMEYTQPSDDAVRSLFCLIIIVKLDCYRRGSSWLCDLDP